jgi:hypothetical protein
VLRVRRVLEHVAQLFDLAPRDAAQHEHDHVLVVRGARLRVKAELAAER